MMRSFMFIYCQDYSQRHIFILTNKEIDNTFCMSFIYEILSLFVPTFILINSNTENALHAPFTYKFAKRKGLICYRRLYLYLFLFKYHLSSRAWNLNLNSLSILFITINVHHHFWK